jgi:hypothetical protein
MNYYYIESVKGPFDSKYNGAQYVTIYLRDLGTLELAITYVSVSNTNMTNWRQILEDEANQLGQVIKNIKQKTRFKEPIFSKGRRPFPVMNADSVEVELTGKKLDIEECIDYHHDHRYINRSDDWL